MKALLLALLAAGCMTESAHSQNLLPSDAAHLTESEERALVDAACPGKSERFAGRGDQGYGLACSAIEGRPEIRNENGFLETDWTLVAVYLGNFESASSENAALVVQSVDMPTNMDNHAILLAKENGTWKKRSFHSALIRDVCHKVKARGGRQVLLCETGFAWQGAFGREIYAVDFSPAAGGSKETVFSVSDNRGFCGSQNGGILTVSEIEKVAFADRGGDGLLDVTITAAHGRMRLTKKQEEDCIATAPDIPMQHYRILFHFDGEHFKVSPGSAATMKLFEH